MHEVLKFLMIPDLVFFMKPLSSAWAKNCSSVAEMWMVRP